MAEELDNLSSPPGQLRINSREGGSGCTGLWGGGGSSGSPQQLERGEYGFIWRGLGVVSFEVLPLWAESMGNSTAHLSCPNLILRPGSQFGVRGRFRRDSLAMGQSPLNLSLSDRTER